MSSNYYLGRTPVETLGNSPAFFYALRRDDDGQLYIVRSEQLKDNEMIDINEPGDLADNFEDFEAGVDYYEGVDANHDRVFKNLKYTQYRWDDRPIFYYVDEEGNLIAKVFDNYVYPTGVAE